MARDSKRESRLRRAWKVRAELARRRKVRLCMFRSPRHIYVQVIEGDGRVLASASTLEPEMRKAIANGGGVEAARMVGLRIAEKARAAGVARVSFDRSGFKYHGRTKALADAAREGGLEF